MWRVPRPVSRATGKAQHMRRGCMPGHTTCPLANRHYSARKLSWCTCSLTMPRCCQVLRLEVAARLMD